jgi:hypothetical protein
LNVRNTILRGFQSAAGTGLKVAPSAGTNEVFLENVTVSENGTAADGFGIQIAPTGSGTVRGLLDRVTIKNSGAGLRADTTATSGNVSLVVRNSTASGNDRAGFAIVSNSTTSQVLLDTCSATGNQNGVSTQGGAVFMTRSSVVFNQNGSCTVRPTGPRRVDCRL